MHSLFFSKRVGHCCVSPLPDLRKLFHVLCFYYHHQPHKWREWKSLGLHPTKTSVGSLYSLLSAFYAQTRFNKDLTEQHLGERASFSVFTGSTAKSLFTWKSVCVMQTLASVSLCFWKYLREMKHQKFTSNVRRDGISKTDVGSCVCATALQSHVGVYVLTWSQVIHLTWGPAP